MLNEFPHDKAGVAFEEIRKDEVAFDGERLSDETALKLVLQDVKIAEASNTSRTLPSDWNLADDLYRSYVAPRTWPNSNVARSSIPMPVVMEAVETLLPQAHMAFFSDPQPFLLDPMGITPAVAARSTAKVVSWSLKLTRFKEEIRKILKDAFLYGTCVGKYGWRKRKVTKRKYSKGEKHAVVPKDEEQEISVPTWERVSLRRLIVDPFLQSQDIRDAAWVAQQSFITANDLVSLADEGYKNVPTKSELAAILAARTEATKNSLLEQTPNNWREYKASEPTEQRSADPLKQPLEILEYWTSDRVITVLQRCIVIQNDENEFEELPYRSCSFIDFPNSFYGVGVAKLLEGEQKFQTGVLNAWVDSLSLKLAPVLLRKKGIGTTSQNIPLGPGKVLNEEEMVPLSMESVSQEALTALGASESRASRRVGANYGPEMPTQAMRTAEGVQAFTSGVQVRLQYFIETFADLVFIPAIEAFIQLAKDHLDQKELRTILTEEEGKEFAGDLMEIYNGMYAVDVLSSTKLTGRRNMMQMATPIMQLLGQPALQQSFQTQNKKFDYVEFFNQVLDLTGWPRTDLVVEMTPQDAQRAQQQNPAVVKAQMEGAKMQQQHQNDLELEESKGTTRAGVQVVKHILDESSAEKAMKNAPLALQGQGQPGAPQQ
jgi:hypothetical protein